MTQPTVCCIMLVNGREAMVRRAIKSFREQTYENKWLLMFDTGERPFRLYQGEGETDRINHVIFGTGSGLDTIGQLRNEANSICSADILVHADSDDWSHPNRIAEQVALLQASKKQCVGYRDMLFWQEPSGELIFDEANASKPGKHWPMDVHRREFEGAAWLYSNPDQKYCLGTSLCYWRSVWEQRPFPDLPKAKGGTGEDVEWLKGVDSLGISGVKEQVGFEWDWSKFRSVAMVEGEPRMIASIHGDNTQYYGGDLLEQSTSWRRVPEWDQYCRERMNL